MAMAGVTFSTLVREVWFPELFSTYFLNDWLFSQQYFPMRDALGGSTISTGYEYSVSSNTGTMNYDDAMVEPYTSNQVRAYFNKDHFQESVRIFGVYMDYLNNGGTETGALDYARKALETGVRNLRDKAVTTMLTDLETHIDSSTAFSDASLSRTTYASLKSYEEATSTALALAHMEDAEEALETRTTYGGTFTDLNNCVWLVPRNQKTNISRLSAGAQYHEQNTQQGGPIDAGKFLRLTHNEVPIQSVPDMTTTVLLLCHRPDISIIQTKPVTVIPKQEAAYTDLYELVCAYNIDIQQPGNHAKLSGKTA